MYKQETDRWHPLALIFVPSPAVGVEGRAWSPEKEEVDGAAQAGGEGPGSHA